MGISASRYRRGENSEEQSDTDVSDVVEVLNFLLRSGQLNVLMSRERDYRTAMENNANQQVVQIGEYGFDVSSYGRLNNLIPVPLPPKVYSFPDTATMAKSDIKMQTERSSGLLHKVNQNKPTNIVNMLRDRQIGMTSFNNFTAGDRCKISNYYLPGKMKYIDKYGHKAYCCVLSKDGSKLVTSCQDRQMHLYDASTPTFKKLKSERTIDSEWSVLDTIFSPDSGSVFYSSWSHNVHMWKIDGEPGQHEILQLQPDSPRFAVFSLSSSYDGSRILAGSNDGCLYVYDTQSNRNILRLDGHEDDVNAVSFEHDSPFIIYSGSDDGLCKVWDCRTVNESYPSPVTVFAGHRDGISSLDIRNDNRHVITNSKDQTIKLWDMRYPSGKDGERSTREAVGQQHWDYRWQKVPNKLLRTKTNLRGDTSIMTYRGHSMLQTLIRARFSPLQTTGQRFIYTGCAAGRVIVYDLITGNIAKTLFGHAGNVRDVSWHPSRSEIISASWDCSVCCWSSNPNEMETETKTTLDRQDSERVGVNQPPAKRVRRSARIAARNAHNGNTST